jgi:hypothetical protein
MDAWTYYFTGFSSLLNAALSVMTTLYDSSIFYVILSFLTAYSFLAASSGFLPLPSYDFFSLALITSFLAPLFSNFPCIYL